MPQDWEWLTRVSNLSPSPLGLPSADDRPEGFRISSSCSFGLAGADQMAESRTGRQTTLECLPSFLANGTWASRALGLFNPPQVPTKNLAILFSQNNHLARHRSPPQPPPPTSRHCRVVSPRPARLPCSYLPRRVDASSFEAVLFFLARDQLSGMCTVQPTHHPCAARP